MNHGFKARATRIPYCNGSYRAIDSRKHRVEIRVVGDSST